MIQKPQSLSKLKASLGEHAFSKNHNARGAYINNNYKNFIKNLY